MEERPKRWINTKVPGQFCYVTSTCLDFAHLFHRQEMRTKMAVILLENCQMNRARLHAFVVMSHHLHLLVRPNDDQTISQLMSKVKRQSALTLGPKFNDFERNQLNAQYGLNDHRFWKAGFRGFPIYTEELRLQKLNYIHQNPVRADKVEEAQEYVWSSSHLYALGLFDEDLGLDLQKSIEYYQALL